MFKNAVCYSNLVAQVSVSCQGCQGVKSDVSREKHLLLGQVYQSVSIGMGRAGVEQFYHSVT